MKLAYSNIGFAKKDDERACELLQQNGFSGLEIAPSRIFGENPYQNIEAASRFAQDMKDKYNLEICSMQSIWYKRTEKIFGGSAEKNFLLDYTKKAIDFAQGLGCRNVVFDCPKNRNMPRGASKTEFTDFLIRLTGYARRRGCVLGLEASPAIYGTNIMNSTTEAANFIERTADPALQLNLDFGTIIQNEENLYYLPEYIPFLSHIHISEPHLARLEKRAEHKKLAQILTDGGYEGYVSVETACQDFDTVKQQVQYLKEIFG